MDIGSHYLKNLTTGLAPEGGFRSWWKSLKTGEKILLVAIVVIFLVLFYISLDANKYAATVHVIAGQGKVGINPTTEVLDFGDLSPGTSAVRRVDVQNKTPIPYFVAVFRFGGINDLMKLDRNFFAIRPGERAKIEFTVFMPASAPINATMSGRVFIFKIPGFWK